METHLEGTMNGVSYEGYNVWSLIYRLEVTENNREGKMYGDSCRCYSVWRLI